MSDLIKVRNHRTLKYTTLNLIVTEDPRLSSAAKWIHTYCISRPPDWEIRLADIYKRVRDGKQRLMTGLKELQQYGYLVITKERNEKGRFEGTTWDVYEEPAGSVPGPDPEPENPDHGDAQNHAHENAQTPESKNPDSGKPDSGKPESGIPESGTNNKVPIHKKTIKKKTSFAQSEFAHERDDRVDDTEEGQPSASPTSATNPAARGEAKTPRSEAPPKEPKPRARKSRNDEPDGFTAFYVDYPVKKDRARAIAAWRKLNPDAELQQVLIQDVAQRLERDREWIDGFIPYPTTYLNGRRWEDEIQGPRVSGEERDRKREEAKRKQRIEDESRARREAEAQAQADREQRKAEGLAVDAEWLARLAVGDTLVSKKSGKRVVITEIHKGKQIVSVRPEGSKDAPAPLGFARLGDWEHEAAA